MKKIVALCTMITAAFMFVGCGKSGGEASGEQRTIQEIQAQEGIPVRVDSARVGTVRLIEKTSGTAEGIRQSYLANGLGGTLQKINVKAGQRVKEGQVIARMYFEDGSPRTVAKANYDYAEKLYERTQKLLDEGAATQEQVEGARVKYEDAQKGLKGANVAEFVTAPFSGVVLEILESEGTKIAERTPIVNMADYSKIKIDAMVNELNINKYTVGQRVFVMTEEGDTIWGRATSVAVGGAAQYHSFRVTFEFANPKNNLKVGMFKEVYVIIEEKQNTVSVPVDAVVSRGGRFGVFVIEGDKAMLRPVELGINSGSDVEIISGVKEGDLYVIAGMSLLSNDVKVKITE